MSSELWTNRELAEYVRVSVNTVDYWRFMGTGPRFVRVGRHVRYQQSDIDRWLTSNAADCTGGTERR